MKNDRTLTFVRTLIREVLNNAKIELFESTLSRLWQHIEGDENFGVISPFRKNISKEENLNRYKELKTFVRNSLNLGYIELEGGFQEEGEWIKEKSLFIPNINKKDLLELGEKYDQYSVIYKDKDSFVEIGTNDIAGKGSIKNDFIKKGWNKNLTINSDITKEFFSRLLKGGNRDDKFLFNIDESYLLELIPQSFNEAVYHKEKNINYIKILTCVAFTF